MIHNRRWHKQLGYESLQEALGALTVDDLKQRGRLFAARVPGRKADLIKHLVGQLAGEKLHRFHEALDELPQKVVAEAVHAPGFKLDAAKFRAKYGKVPTWSTGYGAYGSKHRQPPAPLSVLLFRDGWVPRDLGERLKERVPKPRKARLAAVSELPPKMPGHEPADDLDLHEDARSGRLVQEETALAALHDVRAMLSFVDAGKVSVGAKTGQELLDAGPTDGGPVVPDQSTPADHGTTPDAESEAERARRVLRDHGQRFCVVHVPPRSDADLAEVAVAPTSSG